MMIVMAMTLLVWSVMGFWMLEGFWVGCRVKKKRQERLKGPQSIKKNIKKSVSVVGIQIKD